MLTDNEIIKALESCGNHLDCVDCECVENCSQDINELNGLTFDLINHLQAENKDLTETIYDLTLEKDALFDKIKELKAEIERLREIRDLCNITILEKNYEIEKLKISDASKEECTIRQYGEIKNFRAELKTAKTEAYKECIEKVKERLAVYSFTSNSTEYDNGVLDCMEWVDSKIEELEKELVDMAAR